MRVFPSQKTTLIQKISLCETAVSKNETRMNTLQKRHMGFHPPTMTAIFNKVFYEFSANAKNIFFSLFTETKTVFL